MQKTFLYGIMVGIACASVIFLLPFAESSNIPPTDAFSKVYINGQLIDANKYNDELYIITNGSLTASINGDSVTIKISQFDCPILRAVTGIDTNGNFVCTVI